MESSAWSHSYADPPANRQPRYANNVLQTNVASQQSYQQHSGSPAQKLPPAQQPFQSTPSQSGYQAYQSSSHQHTPSVSSGTTLATRGETGDYMDIQMQDAGDMYRKQYTQAPRQQQPQQQLPPQASRQTSYLQNEDSSASQRYSPMNTTQPQYTPAGIHQPPSGTNFSQMPSYQQGPRQSPTRTNYSQSQASSQTYYSTQVDSPRSERVPGQQSGMPMHNISSHQQTPSRTMSINSPPHLPPIAISTDSNGQRIYQQPNVISQPNFDHPPSPRAVQRHQPQQEPPPHLIRIGNVQELQPRVNAQPAFRRANPDGGFISPLQALTSNLPATYRLCNPNFKYESSKNPRRVLTKPSKGVKNDGYDNEDSDYILYVNDTLGSEENGHKNRYLILDVLGQGTFGQVVKCQNLKTQEVVAVKVIKNRTAYFNQSMMEVSVLDLLNSKLDKNDDHHILRLKDTFIHRQHLCLVFELLSVNLYELIKQNQFRGLSTTLVRVFAQQLLHALALLNKANLIHCDLKPENILLKNLESPMIKVIDFGSACDERQTVYTYIQSRFYRSPEVLLGLPYSSAIDMWSLGCIVVELFLGLPLFPGSSEYNQVSRITEMLGVPPAWMIEMGKQSGEFFERVEDEYGRKTYRLKSMEQYSREHNTKEQPSKKYFQATTLPEIIRSYAMPRKNMKPIEIEREMNNRVAFIDFVRGLLNINPLERWSPQQAKLHPFITQQKYTGPFVPPMNVKSSQKSPAPGTSQQIAAQTKHQEQELKQRQAQQAQLQQQQQAAAAAQLQAQQQFNNQQSFHQPPVYNNMYNPPQPTTIAPPSYSSSNPSYNPTLLPTHNQPSQNSPHHQPNQYQNNLYAQAATRNAAQRQRASTHVDGVPVAIQKAASLMDPAQPIRLQPSPAYYPPPPEIDANGNRTRKTSRAGNGQYGSGRGNRDLIRNLEGTLEDGLFNSGNHWGGGS